MKKALLIYGFSVVIASSLFISSQSSAKTVKACEEEWKANKATIQASGKKKKDFITECRAETASAEPSAAPATPPGTSNSPATASPTRSAKTLRACAAEWMANKESLQAGGKTRKDFISECRAGAETTAAATTAAPAGMTPSVAPTAGRKTVKACEAEWKANKPAIQASGKKKTDFMTECRAEPGSTQTAAPAPQPAEQPKPEVATAPQPTTPAQPKSEAAPQSTTTAQPKSASTPQSTTPAQPRSEATTAPAPQGPTASLATGQFTTEADAKSHCPGDTVVWANTRSRVYHYASSRRYGHTKLGAYMCEKETAAAGMRAAKRERRL